MPPNSLLQTQPNHRCHPTPFCHLLPISFKIVLIVFLSCHVHALATPYTLTFTLMPNMIVLWSAFISVFTLRSLFAFTLVCQLKKALNMEALHKDSVTQAGCSRCSSRPKGSRVSCYLFFRDRRQVFLSHYSKILIHWTITLPLGVDRRSPWSPVAGSFNCFGQKTSMFVTLFTFGIRYML